MKQENDKLENYAFTDAFFEKGNIFLKLRQILVAALGWICFIIPTFITSCTYLYYCSNGEFGIRFWKYSKGVLEIKFLALILTFFSIITFIYATSMTIIQNNRRESVVEKWPTFDSVSSIERKEKAERFMSERFGEENIRHNLKYFEVLPEKNIQSGELSRVLQVNKKGD